MSISAEEIVILLRGEAPLGLRSRFLAEVAESNGALAGMLKATEAWAHRLNPNCPSPPSRRAGDKAVVTVLRKAAFWDDEGDEAGKGLVGVKDLVDYIRGTASPGTADKLKKALADPSSELSRLFEQMEGDSTKRSRTSSESRRRKKR